MLAEAYGVDVYKARVQLFPKFIEDKRDWIESISNNLLTIKKRSLDDYLSDFLRPDMPLDEIGILMFSRMMHKHCAVFFNEVWWTTKREADLSKIDCWLIYRGKCKYSNTVPLTKEEWKSRKDYLKSAVKAYFDANETDVANGGNVVGSVSKVEESEDQLLEEVEETLDVSVKPKTPRKPKPVVEPVRRSLRIRNQDERLTAGILGNLHSTSTPRPSRNQHSTSTPRQSRNQQSTSTPSRSSSVHSTSSSESRHSTKPKQRTTRNSLRSAATSSVAKAAKIKGKFSVSNFVLKKRKPKRKPKKCSSCKQEFPTYITLAVHVKKDHPDYKYKCRYCPKTFSSASWKYQHQARHKGLKYQCGLDTCGKLFQFAYQLRDHKKKHTKKGLYTCSIRGCKKGFTTKRARNYHEQDHMVSDKEKLVCDFKQKDTDEPCGKTFSRPNLLKQHMNGHIGKKLVSHCGKVYNWPNARKYHQDNCEECQKSKVKPLYRFKTEK